MLEDPQTDNFYKLNARCYAQRQQSALFVKERDALIRRLPPGGRILEIGCGAGYDAAAFLRSGFNVTLIDASAEMATIATKRTGQTVFVQNFLDFSTEKKFNGIWAAASLLHTRCHLLPTVFSRMALLLHDNGCVSVSFKASEQSWRDQFGRFFCAMNQDILLALIEQAGLKAMRFNTFIDDGMDHQPTRWIWAHAQKN